MKKQLETIKSLSNNFEWSRYRELHTLLLKQYDTEIQNAKKHACDLILSNTKYKAKADWKIRNTDTNITCNSHFQSNLTADELNSFVVEVAKELWRKIPDVTESFLLTLIYLEPVDEDDVLNAFLSFNNSSATDIFQLNHRILSNTNDLILTPFTFLINKYFSTRDFSSSYKINKVLPFLKKYYS